MRVLLWHVHGSWTTAFVQGRHDYLLPVTPERGAWGGGRATTWDWPASVVEVPADTLRDAEVDVVLVQRPEELRLAQEWLGRPLGRGGVPAVFVEHNAPRGDVPGTRHPVGDRDDLLLVHVTAFNELMYDNGRAPTTVVEHGIVDPGARWTGVLARCAVAVNEPIRRGRVTGTDLLPRFAEVAPLDVFGMQVAGLGAHLAPAGLDPARLAEFDDLPQHAMHAEIARRRVYVHTSRWTSLGLSLLEAMHLAMPVVVLGCTEAYEAVPAGAGVVSTRVDRLLDAVRWLVEDRDAAREVGESARSAVLARYGLKRFLDDWDRILWEVAR